VVETTFVSICTTANGARNTSGRGGGGEGGNAKGSGAKLPSGGSKAANTTNEIAEIFDVRSAGIPTGKVTVSAVTSRVCCNTQVVNSASLGISSGVRGGVIGVCGTGPHLRNEGINIGVAQIGAEEVDMRLIARQPSH
jgi:hypothetical protein